MKKERILHLTLKKKWFDMIAYGIKKEEYRDIKPYWTKRFKNFLINKPFDFIIFRNGYSSDSPTMKVKLNGIDFGISKKEWSDKETECYVLYLGDVIWNNSIN